MKLDTDLTPVAANTFVARRGVEVPPCVDEPFPAWDEYLAARDLARLLRRPPWLLCGMVLLRRFPDKHRFRDPAIGWFKSDILDWMGRASSADAAANSLLEQPQKIAPPSGNSLSIEKERRE
jgi:hypothetical protein